MLQQDQLQLVHIHTVEYKFKTQKSGQIFSRNYIIFSYKVNLKIEVNYMKKLSKTVIQAIEYSINNPKESLTSIGEKFKIDRHSISKHKDDYMLYKYQNHKDSSDEYLYYFSEEELNKIQYFSQHILTESYSCIKEHFNNELPKAKTLYNYCGILGLPYLTGRKNKYGYDRNKFAKIETEEDAYWLGFITADGCIIEGRWLHLGLAEKDIDHVRKFCKYMGYSSEETEQAIKHTVGGAYTKDNPVVAIKVCSLQIIENLKDKGIQPRKSGKEKPYICSSTELEKAYVRGLIDGDGYIRSTQYGMGIVGSYEICKYVQDFITKNICDISSNSIREHGIIYKLELTGRIQTTNILSYLYKNSNVYLERKRKLFENKYKALP